MNTREKLLSSCILDRCLDILPMGMGILDEQFRFLYCNQVMAKILGVERDLIEGKLQKEVLLEAYINNTGIRIDSDSFDDWFDNLMYVQIEKSEANFISDTNDGKYYKMHRLKLPEGLNIVLVADVTELKLIQSSMETALAKIEEIARTDELTSVANRRHFLEV